MRVKRKEPSFGEGLLEGLREAVAWKRGEVALEAVNLLGRLTPRRRRSQLFAWASAALAQTPRESSA